MRLPIRKARTEPRMTPFAKVVSWVGGILGVGIYVGAGYTIDSCDKYWVYSIGGSWCAPLRILYDIIKWFQ
jgi:hypothetical protein